MALRAGCPVTTAGLSINRFCSSGLQTIALAAQRIIAGEGEIYAAGGLESISCIQNQANHAHAQRADGSSSTSRRSTGTCCRRRRPWRSATTFGRQVQDEYGVESQLRAAAAAQAGRFQEEIVPLTTTMAVADKDAGTIGTREVTLAADEGIRPDTTYEGVAKIRPAVPGGVIAAGNASQFSDGASMCIVMDAKRAEKKGLAPLGIFRGFQVAGCEPDEMGIGPVFAVPKLLAKAGLKVDDIGLWELNEAFAVQVIYCRDRLGIPDERLNVDGGAIAVGHPLRGQRLAPRGTCADRGQAARRQVRRGHDVHRRRHGGGGIVRGGVRLARSQPRIQRGPLVPDTDYDTWVVCRHRFATSGQSAVITVNTTLEKRSELCRLPRITCRLRSTPRRIRSIASGRIGAHESQHLLGFEPGDPRGARVRRSAPHGHRARCRRTHARTACAGRGGGRPPA